MILLFFAKHLFINMKVTMHTHMENHEENEIKNTIHDPNSTKDD